MNFEDLLSMVNEYNETYVTESLKGSIARGTLTTGSKVKKGVNWAKDKGNNIVSSVKSKHEESKNASKEYKDLSDAAKLEGDDKLSKKYQNKALMKNKQQVVTNIAANGVKTVVKGAGVATSTTLGTAGNAIGAVVMTPKMGKDIIKYKSDPNELKKKLKESKDKIIKIRNTVISGSLGVTAAAVGPIDWAGKAIAALGMVGAKVQKDEGLSGAIADGLLLGPAVMKKIADLASKKIFGKEAIEVLKDVSDKIVKTLDNWSKSDLIDKMGKNVPALESVFNEFIIPFTESVNNAINEHTRDIILALETDENSFLTAEELQYLKECIGVTKKYTSRFIS